MTLLLFLIELILLCGMRIFSDVYNLDAKECQRPLLMVSSGYLDAKKYPGRVLQLEYKWGNYLWKYVRPQAVFMLTNYASGYIGLGFGLELSLSKHIYLIPSFSPGYYWQGRGKNLGFPIEFRSGLELSYEMKTNYRIGIQICHLSNAHLSRRNPGMNAVTMGLGFPLY